MGQFVHLFQEVRISDSGLYQRSRALPSEGRTSLFNGISPCIPVESRSADPQRLLNGTPVICEIVNTNVKPGAKRRDAAHRCLSVVLTLRVRTVGQEPIRA